MLGVWLGWGGFHYFSGEEVDKFLVTCFYGGYFFGVFLDDLVDQAVEFSGGGGFEAFFLYDGCDFLVGGF